MTFVTYVAQGISEETRDLSFWTVLCPDHQYYVNVTMRHEDRQRASDEEFLNLLAAHREMAVMEMQDIGCEHPVPEIEEWDR